MQEIKLIYEAAVSAVNGQNLIQANVRLEKNKLIIRDQTVLIKNNVYLIGFGKAVLGMAVEIEAMFRPQRLKGILSVPFGSVGILKPQFNKNSEIEIRECARNNLPDEASCQNTQLIQNFVKHCTKDDVVLVLISGGGSACLSSPKSPLSLEDKLKTIKLLVQSGANIKELNKVRKKLSDVKGGQLAEIVYPATLVSLIISDIVGDPLQDIASGPTVLNEDLWSDARDIVIKYGLQNKVSKNVMTILSHETPHQDTKYFENVHNHIIGNNRAALLGAKWKAESLGFQTVILSSDIEGLGDDICRGYVDLVAWIDQLRKQRTIQVGKDKNNIKEQDMKQNLHHIVSDWQPNKTAVQELAIAVSNVNKLKLCVVCGGEITLNMNNNSAIGKGGRNLHLTLQFQYEVRKVLDQTSKVHVWFSSLGTDGIDGPTDVAGSIAYSHEQVDLDQMKHYLDTFDSFNYYKDKNQMVKVGHTGTNVMDVHILVIEEE
ncbi:hypothetical protein M8J76_016355 [Diaphorina citri]|nr:hypothetical protein M8J75_006174 [Diaphorina citri]KAI5746013.1 hypothetical protein M8J76_016355 [Diaphorina citri]